MKNSQFKPKNRWHRIIGHKIALTGGIILIILYLGSIFAGFLAPYPFDYETRSMAYHPPCAIHLLPRPYIYRYHMEFKDGQRIFTTVKTERYYIKFFVKGESYKFWNLFTCTRHFIGVEKPARLFIMGSDWNGRDILSRIIYGSRISLSIGIVGVAISLSLGLIIGGISGYFGGKIDTITMRFIELLMCFPGFYLMLALRAVFPLSMPSTTVYFMIVIILAFISWPGIARVIRGMALSVKQREYVLAARALGSSSTRIIFRHLLPQTFSYALIAATLSIPSYILGESALSLLGLGIMEPYASWGNMLKRAMSITNIQFHPWILIPGIFIFITVMAFNFLGDGLRDMLDPTSQA